MSWLSSISNIAGRAESFLNQMDQAAATSLQEAGIGTPSPNKLPPDPEKKEEPRTEKKEKPPQLATGLYYEPVAQPITPLRTTTTAESKFTKSFKKQPISDVRSSTIDNPRSGTNIGSSASLSNDSLINFLNTPSTKPKTKERLVKTTPTRPRSAMTEQEKKKQEKKNQQSTDRTGWDEIDSTKGPSLSDSASKLKTGSGNYGYYQPQSLTPPPPHLSDIPVLDLDLSSHPTSSSTTVSTNIENNHEQTDTTLYPHSDTTSQSHPDTTSCPQSNATSFIDDSSSHSHSDTTSHLHSDINSRPHSDTISHPHSDTTSDPRSDTTSHSYDPALTSPQSSNNLQSPNVPLLPLSATPSSSNPDSHTPIPSNIDSQDQLLDSESVSSLTQSSGLPSPVISQPGGGRGKFIQELTTMEHQHVSYDTVNTSNLETENQVLRKEIGALSEELAIVRTRTLENQKSESKYKEEIKALRDQCSKLESHLRHMRSQEDDLTSALEARDSQIHVLRVRLEETDTTVVTLNKKLEEEEKEKQRVIHDVSLSSSAQNQALESVNVQLQQVQARLTNEQELNETLKNELSERDVQFNSEMKQLSDALYAQQNETQQLHIQFTDAQKALQKANTDTQRAKKEFEEYKIKAATVLQNKEKVITSLRSSDHTSGLQTSVHETALEDAKAEKQQLLSQIHVLKEQNISLKEDLQNTEDQHAIEMEQTLQQVTMTQESLEEERTRHGNTQDELNRLTEELDQVKHNFVREKGMLASKLREKENEVIVLNTRLAAFGTDQSDSTRKELEGRLQELTESLIQKQTTLEMLSSEKNSLYLQLEKTRGALKEAESTNTIRQTALEIESSSRRASAQIRPMASLLPSANDGTNQGRRHFRRMRTTLDQMDRIGLQIGWVLKNHPWIRVILILYILLLHLWVTFVLLTYKPEIHVEGHHVDSL